MLLLICLTASQSALAQNKVEYRKPAILKNVPKLVLTEFKARYPNVLTQGWYSTHLTYWQQDRSAGWYVDWYGQRSFVVFTYEKPTYFEVEFIDQPGELSRAIFNLHGYWHETRSRVKALPLTVQEGLKQTEYNSWYISDLKERIESPGWPIDVYRFSVSRKSQTRIIRMDEKGNIIQAKYLGEDEE
ncbi:MAG: hypothetical protein HKN39_07700 [Flavobacteriales bacterium]|nr:hypothetical protein [Flavobacteriales bacterium]